MENDKALECQYNQYLNEELVVEPNEIQLIGYD